MHLLSYIPLNCLRKQSSTGQLSVQRSDELAPSILIASASAVAPMAPTHPHTHPPHTVHSLVSRPSTPPVFAVYCKRSRRYHIHTYTHSHNTHTHTHHTQHQPPPTSQSSPCHMDNCNTDHGTGASCVPALGVHTVHSNQPAWEDDPHCIHIPVSICDSYKVVQGSLCPKR